MKILLVSHGGLASGLLGSFEMIAGKNECISAISLTDEGIGEFSKQLTQYLENHENEQVLILCDIKGGTPFNEAYREYLAKPNQIKVISGMNLPMLIEIGVMLQDDSDIAQLVEIGINAGKTSIEGIVDETETDDEMIEF